MLMARAYVWEIDDFVQALISNPFPWGYMGKKVNVYLDDDTLELWKTIPSGERSAVIKRAIQDAASMQPEDERVAKLQKLRIKKENLEIILFGMRIRNL